MSLKGVAGWGSQTKGRRGGGVWPKAEKKVTSPILMAEVVDMPEGTLDGVQDVFELL